MRYSRTYYLNNSNTNAFPERVFMEKDSVVIKDGKKGILLKYCSQHPLEYNRVGNMLNELFDIKSAEITLLVTYIVCEYERIYHGQDKEN